VTSERVHVWCIDSPGFGGAELDLVRVLGMLRAQRNCVLHSPQISPQLLQMLEQNGIQAKPEVAVANTARMGLKGLTVAFRRIRRFPDALFVIWCHHLDSNRWLQLALALLRVRYVLVERLLPSNAINLRNSRLTVPIKRFVSKRAHCVVVCGYSQIEHFAALFSIAPSLLRTIPNSRPVQKISDRATALRRNSERLRNDLGLRVTAKVVICVGRLSEQKRQSVIIDAMSSQALRDLDIQLVLVGEGETRASLELQTKGLPSGTVLFAGHCADVVPFLAAADVFVLPSVAEGLPGALIEAMAAGVPCVATDIPGNRELIINARTGLSFTVDDVGSLASHLHTILMNRKCAESYARAALELIRERYDESVEQAAWNELFRESNNEA
jgi:glycosyltransferase involved in cell wall biosynthesis